MVIAEVQEGKLNHGSLFNAFFFFFCIFANIPLVQTSHTIEHKVKIGSSRYLLREGEQRNMAKAMDIGSCERLGPRTQSIPSSFRS